MAEYFLTPFLHLKLETQSVHSEERNCTNDVDNLNQLGRKDYLV